jgi:hypothetical protein
MKSFHDVLAPNWHAKPGDERTEKTCAAVGDLQSRADAVEADYGDAKDLVVSEAARSLPAGVVALATACDADGRADFESTFKSVHESFHRLMAALKIK